MNFIYVYEYIDFCKCNLSNILYLVLDVYEWSVLFFLEINFFIEFKNLREFVLIFFFLFVNFLG